MIKLLMLEKQIILNIGEIYTLLIRVRLGVVHLLSGVLYKLMVKSKQKNYFVLQALGLFIHQPKLIILNNLTNGITPTQKLGI